MIYSLQRSSVRASERLCHVRPRHDHERFSCPPRSRYSGVPRGQRPLVGCRGKPLPRVWGAQPQGDLLPRIDPLGSRGKPLPRVWGAQPQDDLLPRIDPLGSRGKPLPRVWGAQPQDDLLPRIDPLGSRGKPLPRVWGAPRPFRARVRPNHPGRPAPTGATSEPSRHRSHAAPR